MTERPERRSLVEGLSATTARSNQEREFVYADKSTPAGGSSLPTKPSRPLSRSPLTTRIRDDFAKALKRASLERQLEGLEPNTLQDILEEAIEPWLKANGYLPE